jgi:hypothetical protein
LARQRVRVRKEAAAMMLPRWLATAAAEQEAEQAPPERHL